MPGGAIRINHSTIARYLSAVRVIGAIRTYPAPDEMEFVIDLALVVVRPVIGWLVLAASGLRFGDLLAWTQTFSISREAVDSITRFASTASISF